MTIDDLKPFCCSDSTKQNICKPWTGEGYTQATDGWMLIRVEPIEGVEPNGDAPVTTRLFPSQEPAEWFDLANVQFAPVEICPLCEGKQGTVECPECKGSGEVDLENDYSEYTVDCKTCDGDGETRCKHCHGSGTVEGINVLGVAKFGTSLLKMLLPLPNCKIGITTAIQPAWFRFDGGDGLIMPMR